MANFVIKETEHKVDPRHPESTDKTWKKAYNKGQQLLKEGKGVKFANAGEKEYYNKMLRSNPANIPGLPITHPPLTLPSINGIGEGIETTELPCGHRWSRIRYDRSGKILGCKNGHEFNEQNQQIN